MTDNKLAKQETRPPSFAEIVATKTTQLAGFTEENQFRIRFPREGKIHLGVKKMFTKTNSKTKETYEVESPVATDYFVLPPALLEDADFCDALREIGQDPECPRRLPIWLPSNEPTDNLVSSYDRYGKTRGLVCRSTDGITAKCRNEETGESFEQPCLNKECPHYVKGDCHEIHRLRVFLPDARGVGVWQIDSKSPNNWSNLSCEMTTILGSTGGKLAALDLVLCLEPEERVISYVDRQQQSKTSKVVVHLLHLRSGYKLRDLRREAAKAEADWDMSDVAEVDTDFDEISHDVPDAQETTFVPCDEDGGFEVGQAESQDELEREADAGSIRTELVECCGNLLDVLFTTDVPRASIMKQHLGTTPLNEASVDQLTALHDMLKAVASQKSKSGARSKPSEADNTDPR